MNKGSKEGDELTAAANGVTTAVASPGGDQRPSVEELQAANKDLLTLLLQLNSVNEMVCRTGMPLDRNKALEGIALGVRRELDFDRVAIWRYEAVTRSFVGETGLGLSEELVRSLRFPMHDFIPLVTQVLHEGRVLKQDPMVLGPMLETVYEALGEPVKPSLITPLLSRGKDRCWRLRRVAEGCSKAEAGPERGAEVRLDEEHVTESCLPCPVFPIEGFLWADNARSGRPIHEDLLPLGMFLRQADLMLENSILYTGLGRVTIMDALTGVYNRAYFDHLVGVETERCVRYGYPATVVMLDVFGMKRINDAAGRVTGDRLLTELGELIRRRLRRIDFVARIGPDEFALLLPHTDGTRALLVCERMHRLIAEHPFGMSALREPVRCAMGLAVVPENAQDPDSLMGLADFALNEAQNAGPGVTVRIGDPKPMVTA